jgi:hypothetical protein
MPGRVDAGASTPAARWLGGGVHAGRLRFELRAAPGTYVVPIQLRVSVLVHPPLFAASFSDRHGSRLSFPARRESPHPDAVRCIRIRRRRLDDVGGKPFSRECARRLPRTRGIVQGSDLHRECSDSTRLAPQQPVAPSRRVVGAHSWRKEAKTTRNCEGLRENVSSSVKESAAGSSGLPLFAERFCGGRKDARHAERLGEIA